ncbi:MAG: sigma-70 family RNA polymerase sigma factor [Rubripirellula sp.]|nr:sigma-70 family RNA polymerase sigma factor [Rubripirellula sp.]
MDRESRETESRQLFTHLWLQAEPSVSAYVFASIAGFHDAEDVVQQIAQELARRFEQYDPDRPFVAWALWIAKSRVIDFYRRNKRDHLVFSDELLKQLGEAIAASSGQRHERREALEQCLEHLPERSRQLLDLRYVEEMPASEIASTTDSTTGSVRVLLTRVRGALAECIQRRIAAEAEG